MRTATRGLAVALALTTGCAAAPQIAKLAASGDHRDLRGRPEGASQSSPGKPPILYVALDGVGRDLHYGLLREGKLPNLATLLGGAGGKFPHAHFDEHMLSTLPSSTMAAWATTMTGVAPAEHGVTGNEYFIREDRTFACPAPVSFSSGAPPIEIYTEGYLDKLTAAPAVYERMRERDPDVLVWVVGRPCSPPHSKASWRRRCGRRSPTRSRSASTRSSTRAPSRASSAS